MVDTPPPLPPQQGAMSDEDIAAIMNQSIENAEPIVNQMLDLLSNADAQVALRCAAAVVASISFALDPSDPFSLIGDISSEAESLVEVMAQPQQEEASFGPPV